MKVLLVQAYLGGHEAPVLPLGLTCLAAALRGHEVSIFDTNTVADPFKQLQKITQDFQPDIIGISLRNIDSTNKSKVIFYYGLLKKQIQILKDAGATTLIIGGSGFSMYAGQIMAQQPDINFGVYLEGENTFPALLDNLDQPEKVPAVFYRRDGEIHFSGPATPVEIRQLQAPAWNMISLTPYLAHRDAIGVETKRGCSLNCVYCIYGFLNGKTYRLKKAQQVVDEIEILIRQHNVTRFTFVDSIFNVPLSHAKAICSEIISRNLSVQWSAWFNERFINADFLHLLQKAGCTHCIFSPDGFADTVLTKLGKNLARKDIISSLQLLNKHNHFEVTYNFFRNPPGQTMFNFFGMLFFCLWGRLLLGKRIHFEFSVLRIEPHTGLYDIALEEGVIQENQDLLQPTYYINRKTRYIDSIMDFLLGLWSKRAHANK